MCILEDIPFWLRIIYRLHGIINFSCSTSGSFYSRCFTRLCCVPILAFYTYCCSMWLVRRINGSNTTVDKIDLIVSSVGVLSTTVSLLTFILRSNRLKFFLLQLNELKLNYNRKLKNDYLKNSVFVVTALLWSFLLVFPRTFVSVAYYVLPAVIGLFDHLFLSEILEFVRLELVLINEELHRKATGMLSIRTTSIKNTVIHDLKDKEIYFILARIEEITLRHSDLVVLALDINKLFDITTISSMITWLVYVVDAIYYLIHIADISFFDLIFTCLYALLFFLWLPVMARTYRLARKEVNQTSEFVHDIWNQRCQTGNLGKTMLHLQLVSVRLFSNKLCFTAGNFFNLDETFCHIMVGAAATYVVILLQF
ncbi:hypothetical protein Zmor_020428 [Zophobas morio]|uniref:Gustatory receptor n=1 Tax=Zophobas morio TaxID=2755281 RepID=A0AA38MAB2_9CUCU|nr:hypothetical protein Zmor_020428 [Zophobas morio]